MRNSFSGIGFVLTLIVMLIVLLLVAKVWTKMAPTAMEITNPRLPGDTEATGGEDGEAPAGHLPRLGEMKENADEHAKQLEDARKAIDE